MSLQERLEDRYNIHNYADFVGRLGGLVSVDISGIDYDDLQLENGYDYDEETGEYIEIFQYFFIGSPDFALTHTDEIIYYHDKMDVYILGVTHWGTSWDHVPAPTLHEAAWEEEFYKDIES